MSVPHLSEQDLKSEIARLGRHSRTFIAIYGTGDEAEVPLEGIGMVKVIPVRSELELRAQLPPLSERPYRAFLVPFQGVLPADIASRFISQGTIARIGPAAKLAARTGVPFAQDSAARLKLATYLLRSDNPTTFYPVKAPSLDAEALMAAWLSKDWGTPVEGGLAADALLGWAAANARGGVFDQEMNSPAAAGVAEELSDHLRAQCGEVAAVILNAWRIGVGPQLLGVALLAEVLAPQFDRELKRWPREILLTLSMKVPSVEAESVVGALGKLARPALSWLRSNEPSAIARVLSYADKLVEGEEFDEYLVTSTRLPSAWKLRLSALGQELSALATVPSREGLKRAQDAWTQLEKHDFFLAPEHASLIRRAEMALRLAAWLVARPELHMDAPPSPYADVETLGSWYAEEGGYLDWARRVARAERTKELAAGIQAVVHAVDRARQELDCRFASALQNWTSYGRPSPNVLPIDSAIKRVGARFLEQEQDRSLLILLMDGMAWAQTVELLTSLGEDGRQWGPLAWHHIGKNRVGRGAYPVMLAALPTITEVSRAAFFAGAMPKNGTKLDTKNDVEHFANNKALTQFCQSRLQPQLMLRGDGHTSDGALTDQALRMIGATKEQRVVGLVVNAIDASLKGDSQHETSWRLDNIRSLPQIFDAAEQAGRHILIAADHGHVPADRLKGIGQSLGGGARYRPWTGGSDELVPGERKFSGEGVYLAKGSEAVVLLEHDGVRYGGAAHAGEHGGAALAEVVAPCVLLGWNDEVRTQQDPALAVRPLYVPDWWSMSLPEERNLVRDEPAPRPKKKATLADSKQVELPGIAPTAEPPEEGPPSRSPASVIKPEELLADLYNSEMLKARANTVELRKKVVAAVHFLLVRSNAAPSAAFAAHAGVPGFQASSYVGILQGVLNLDGYEVLRFDRASQQVFLDPEKLKQQFDVEL